MTRVSKERICKGYLVDDGTMDTIIRCSICGQEERFNPEPPDDDSEDWDRVEDASRCSKQTMNVRRTYESTDARKPTPTRI